MFWLTDVSCQHKGFKCLANALLLFSHLVMSKSFVTPWTVACQASLSIGFLRQNTGVGCHFLLQWIIPTQGLNLRLLHCRQSLYHWASKKATFSIILRLWADVDWAVLHQSLGGFVVFSRITSVGMPVFQVLLWPVRYCVIKTRN